MPLDRHAAVLVSEVGRLRHVAEESDLDYAGEHLDAREELHASTVSAGYSTNRLRNSYSVRVLHD